MIKLEVFGVLGAIKRVMSFEVLDIKKGKVINDIFRKERKYLTEFDILENWKGSPMFRHEKNIKSPDSRA